MKAEKRKPSTDVTAGPGTEVAAMPHLMQLTLIKPDPNRHSYYLHLRGTTVGPLSQRQLWSQKRVRREFCVVGLYLPRVTETKYEECLRTWFSPLFEGRPLPDTIPEDRAT